MNDSTNPTLNILIRTSNRPKGFKRLLDSIEKQSYKNINIFVSVDNEESLDYIPEDINTIFCIKSKDGNSQHNLYLNHLLQEVKEGFIIVIDDDDFVKNKTAIAKLMKSVEENSLNICKMQWPTKRVIPEPEYFTTPFIRKHIGMPCLIFHTNYKEKIKFDANKAADFRTANMLLNFVKPNFINEIVVHIGNTGLNGKSIDIDD